MMFYKRRPTKKDLEDTKEKFVTRKAGVLPDSGVARETAKWNVQLRDNSVGTVSFSRDNLLVFFNGHPVPEVELRFRDDQYDVLLYFKIGCDDFCIFSDVDIKDKKLPMTNYLYINGEVAGEKKYNKQKDHDEVCGTTETAMELGYRVIPENKPRLPMEIFLEEDAAMQRYYEQYGDDGK